MNTHHYKKQMVQAVVCFLISVLAFAFIYKGIPIVYSTNDDRMIAEIVSGQFTGTPESYGIQMTYGFTWFLSRLYLITRSLNWYGIMLMAAQVTAFTAVLYRIQSFFADRRKKAEILLATIGIFMVLWLKVFVQMTYTTTAAFVGCAAIFWYAASKTDRKNIIVTGILANLAFSIRPNVFYMLLPATGLIYLWKLIGKKELGWRTVAAPFMILTVTAGLFAADAAAYAQDGWKEFKEFFKDRTDVYDFYDLADYETYPELYEPYGISKEAYNMIRIYDYSVMGDVPKEFFPQYLEAYRQMEKEQGITFSEKLSGAVKTFFQEIGSNAYGTENTVLAVTALLLIVFLLWKKEYLLALYLWIQSLVWMVLWVYFTYWDRAIERIQITMSLIFLAVLLHTAAEIWERALIPEKERRIREAVILTVILVFAGVSFRNYRYENIEKAYRYEDIQKIQQYCAEDPDRLYYMDVSTMTELYGRVTIKSTGSEYLNYIQLGDWSAYCPHYEKKLKAHGVSEVAESITGENTYVIMLHNYQVQCMKDYLHLEEHWEETVFGAYDQPYAVYQFQKVKE